MMTIGTTIGTLGTKPPNYPLQPTARGAVAEFGRWIEMRIFFCVLATLVFSGCGSDAPTHRLTLIKGGSSVESQPPTLDPILVHEIRVGYPFALSNAVEHAAIKGQLDRKPNGEIHFKGEAHVGSTWTRYDTGVEVGEMVIFGSAAFSGHVRMFFVKFEEIQPSAAANSNFVASR
jgi:hypothetical protein